MGRRGVVKGKLTTGSKALRPCVLMGDQYPMWLPVVKRLGFKPVLVLLETERFIEVVESQVAEECAIIASSKLDVLAAAAPARFTHSDAVLFADGRINQFMLDLSEIMRIEVVVGQGRPRRQPRGWKISTSVQEHHLCGGVTHTRTHVTTCVRLSSGQVSLPVVATPPTIPRDLSTLLSSMVGSKLRRAAPSQRHLNNYEVRNVRAATPSRPITSLAVYHGGGWLPAEPSLGTQVLTPYALAAPRWVIRRLEPAEYLQVYDYPAAMIPSMVSVVTASNCPALVPCSSLFYGAVQGFQALLDNGGGGTVSFSSAPRKERKREDQDLAALSMVPAVKKQKLTHPKLQQKVDSLVLGRFDSAYDKLRSTTRICRRPAETPHASDKKVHHLDLDKLVDDVQREKRERKATKSDDAEVPIYLWTEHYLEESTYDWNAIAQRRGLTPGQQQSTIEWAMETLRHFFAIRKWKRSLTRSFFKWIKVKTGTVDMVNSSPIIAQDSSRSHTWRSLGGNFKKDKQGKWIESGGAPLEVKVYKWTDDGRHTYMKWRAAAFKSKQEDWIAAADAIERGANSTWWEWQDGSRPFHWRWPNWYQKTIRDGLQVYLDRDKIPEYMVPQKGEADSSTREAMKKKLNKVRVRRYITGGLVLSLTSFFSVPKGETDIRMVYDGTKSGLNEAMWVPRFALPTIDTHLRSIDEGTFLADVDVGDCFLNFPLHDTLQALAGVDLTRYFPNPDGSRVWVRWNRALMGVKSSPYQAVQGMSVVEEVIRGRPNDTKNVFRWDKVRLNCPGDPKYDPSLPWVSKVKSSSKEGSHDQLAADLVGYVDDLRPSGQGRQEAWAASRRTASIMNFLGIQDAARKRRDSSQTPGAWAGAVVLTRPDGVFVMVDEDKWKKAKRMVEEVKKMLEESEKSMDRKRLEEIRGFLNYVVRTYPALKPYLTGFHLTIDGWRSDREKDGWRRRRKSKWKEENEEDELNFMSSEKFPTNQSLTAPKKVEAKPRLLDDIKALRYLMDTERPIPRRVRSATARQVIYCFGDASGAGFGFTHEINGVLYYKYGQWSTLADGKSSNWREAKNLLEGLRDTVIENGARGLEMFIFTDNTTTEAAYWKGTSKSKLLSEIVLEMRKLEMTHDLILHVVHVSGKRMIRSGVDGISRADLSAGVMQGDAMTDHIPLNESAFERSTALRKRFKTALLGLKPTFLEPHQWFDEYHGYGSDGTWWYKWNSVCRKTGCQKIVTPKNGVFCANFCWRRGPYAPCREAYCAKCFTPRGVKPFKIRESVDEEGFVVEERDETRFLCARPGDMLMIPFQCDLCHFRNVMSRDPYHRDARDQEILEFIRRASLDSFWSREPPTVQKNLQGLYRAERTMDRLGMPPMSPPLGPFPLKDVHGMQAAIAILDRSLDKGLYEDQVQYETFRKQRSNIANVYQASPEGLFDVVGAHERNRCWISRVPTHTFWFVRFMDGVHKRVGEVVKPDWPVPAVVIQEIDKRLNAAWENETNPMYMKKIAEIGTWFVGNYCTGLRGEEVLLIELAGTAKSLKFLRDPVEPHFLFKILGRTKGRQLNGRFFWMPCVAETQHTKLKPGRWVKRLVDLIHLEGRTTGWLFQRARRVPQLNEFEEDWYRMLETVQDKTSLIDTTVDLREEAGIARSLRRGVTAHARNQRVDEKLIEAINWWRKETNGPGNRGALPMIDAYSLLDSMKPTYLRFSKAL